MYSPGSAPVVGAAAIQAKAVSDWARSDAANLAYGTTSVSAAGDVAWVATDADFTVSAAGQETTTPVRITFVLEQRAGEWRIVHAHYSVAPAATG
jgi:ketosteroid isomerase-like protein